jgi:hypothetical protein
MNVETYNRLLRFNQAHAEVVSAFAILRKHPAFAYEAEIS